ncbi:hypothetical protein F7725_000796 [Dissostichus mawsoni]|uniref:Uncharacterized protein n=1 Tax=Dissostichus mawsoni TaxID=36200 RepID=A0A7J5ZHC9_DISMA|nr:hypothetical protein F7725_000796 [Dissostichus mawsoni]
MVETAPCPLLTSLMQAHCPSIDSFHSVTLWKESMDGQWACISDVSKGQGAVSTITDTQQSEQMTRSSEMILA